MKRFFAIAIFLTMSTIAANAQCDSEAMTDLYNKFIADHKGSAEQKKTANETAKSYLSKFGECPSEAEQKITAYIKKWQTNYEAHVIEANCTNAVDKTPSQAHELCQPYLAKDPDSLRANLLLSLAGIKAASDPKLKSQTVKTLSKTRDLIKGGKSVDLWIVAENKDETVATLDFLLRISNRRHDTG